MGRILGIDYGTKRIGVAVTDPLMIFASPLETVNTHQFGEFLKRYMSTEKVEAFVIGCPVKMNNQPSESVKHIDPFIKKLERTYPGIPVHRVDERFTSEMALRSMIEGGVTKKDRRDKSMVDKISAAIILQSFIDKRCKAPGSEH